MTQVPSYCPSFQSFLCVCSFSLCPEPACFYIRHFCHLYLVHYAKVSLEHEPKVAFPGTDPSGCVIPVPLHTAGLGLSAAQAPCVTSLHPPTWHVGGKPVLQHCFFSSIGCGGDQQQLPSTCSTISAGQCNLCCPLTAEVPRTEGHILSKSLEHPGMLEKDADSRSSREEIPTGTETEKISSYLWDKGHLFTSCRFLGHLRQVIIQKKIP